MKLPDGRTIVRRYLKTDTVKALHAAARDAVDGVQDTAGQFEMVTTYPAKNLSECLDSTLGEAGLAGAQVVLRFL